MRSRVICRIGFRETGGLTFDEGYADVTAVTIKSSTTVHYCQLPKLAVVDDLRHCRFET
jgi:hypothetical protein